MDVEGEGRKVLGWRLVSLLLELVRAGEEETGGEVLGRGRDRSVLLLDEDAGEGGRRGGL